MLGDFGAQGMPGEEGSYWLLLGFGSKLLLLLSFHWHSWIHLEKESAGGERSRVLLNPKEEKKDALEGNS